MVKRRADDETCPYCGLAYEEFKTGLNCKEVRDSITPDTHPRGSIARRRATVLGFWHEIKQITWAEHIEACAYYYNQYAEH